jgi:adenine-specific DNA glycosylase
MKTFSKVLSFFDFSGRNETVFSNLQISADDIPFPKNQSIVVQVLVSAFLLCSTTVGAILRYFYSLMISFVLKKVFKVHNTSQ